MTPYVDYGVCTFIDCTSSCASIHECVVQNVLPENGLTSILSNKYHRGGAPWWRALSQ